MTDDIKSQVSFILEIDSQLLFQMPFRRHKEMPVFFKTQLTVPAGGDALVSVLRLDFTLSLPYISLR